MDSTTRTDFMAGLKTNGKYAGIVGIYRHNTSADHIGIFDREIIKALAPTVKWIAHNGAGYDQIDVQECKANGEINACYLNRTKDYNCYYLSAGIFVSNTPGAVDEATATTALYLLISTLRQFSLGERSLRSNTWKSPIDPGCTHDLSACTLGILGLGGIGLHLANLAHAFPMRVIYHSRSRNQNAPEWCQYYARMEDMLKESDVLSVHVPLRKDTESLVGEKEIRTMKRGSIIVNTARGKVIDEDAMIRALANGHVRIMLHILAAILINFCSSRLSASMYTQMNQM
jgi:glyoxylate reductase